MAQSKEELLAKARERTAKNRAAKKEAAANQGVEQAPAATPIQDEKPVKQENSEVVDSAKAETPTVSEVESTESTESTGAADSTESTDQEPVKQGKSNDSGSIIVISPFRDKDNFNKTWNIGDNISHFPADRLKKIIDLKLAEKR